MAITVVIPTYNSAKTIEATLDSVLAQSAPVAEILIMDDGSTDNTVALLRRYGPRLTLFEQPNQGVAIARNVLCQRAQGDLIAFLDHDDIWHPDYLATQQKMVAAHPEGVAYFTGHDNFHGRGDYKWNNALALSPAVDEVIAPLDFLKQYHRAPGRFGSMSFLCIPKRIWQKLGPQPLCPEISGVDDFHLYHQLLLLGPFVYHSIPLVAYRITGGAQSASLLKAVSMASRALELLDPLFQAQPDARLRKVFRAAYAAQRREYGKVLMGVGRPREARKQMLLSLTHSSGPRSLVKSLTLLLLTGVPRRFQPHWPSEWKVSHSI